MAQRTEDEPATAPDPRRNPILVGHAEAEAALRRDFESGRLAHAWLLTGPRGVGKATLAYRFARFVLAGGEGATDATGLSIPESHPVFRRVAADGHADMRTLERSVDEKGKMRSDIVVGDVRDAVAFLRLTPAEGGWRVVVVDSADEMNRNATNAILKALEEPAARSLLLLVSHAPGRLLPTIRSRCRRLALRPLAESAVSALLERYAPDLNEADRALLADLTDGSIGRAMALAAVGGLELQREIAAILDAAAPLDVERVHALADRLGRRGADDAFETAGFLIRRWIGQRVLGAAREPSSGLAPSLDRSLEVWDKVGRLFARAGPARLERKHVILGALFALGEAGRG